MADDLSIECNWCGDTVTPQDASYRRIEQVDLETGEDEGIESVYAFCSDVCHEKYRYWELEQVGLDTDESPDGEPQSTEEFVEVEVGKPILRASEGDT